MRFQLWSGSVLIFAQADIDKIRTTIAERISRGRMTMSDFQQYYKDMGYRGLSKTCDTESFIEQIGFKLKRIYTKGTNCIRVTEVVQG